MERSRLGELAVRAGLILGFLLGGAGGAHAFSGGISGYSGREGVTCDSCHQPANFNQAFVRIEGPAAVAPGALGSYTLTLSVGEFPASGVDLAASGGTIIDTNASGTRILNGELTHTAPFNQFLVTLTFDWRAPTTPGTYTLYAAGLAADLSGDTTFDDTVTTTFNVTVAASNQPPVAVITSLGTVEAGQVLTLDGSGSNDPDGTIVSYAWDFGDGTTGTGVQVDHVYATPGTYTVTLTVTDDQGATGTDTKVITVTAPAAPKPPVANAGGPYSGIVNGPVQMDGSASTDPDGTIVSYAWDFGDGTTGTGVMPTHTYTAAGVYTVTLTVTDNDGLTATATTTATIVVPSPPVADPGGPYSGQVGQPVAFDGSRSMDPDGTIVSYRWFFGDNTEGTGPTPTHTYTAAGTYTVTLTVTDNDGLRDTAVTTVTITDPAPPPPAPMPPVADPGGPYTGTTGMPVQMDGSASADPDGTIVSYAWDFGDGTTGTGVMPIHTYAMAGTYTVTLTVTDNDGLTATATTTATITDPVAPPPPPGDTPPGGGNPPGGGMPPVDRDGARLYAENCARCHGGNGLGGSSGESVIGATPADIMEAILENEGGMGELAGLTPEQIAAISRWLNRGIPDKREKKLRKEGKKKYKKYCAACHGKQGTGGGSAGSIVGEGQEAILRAIQDVPEMQFLRELLGDYDAAAIAEFLDYRARKKKHRNHEHRGEDDDEEEDDD